MRMTQSRLPKTKMALLVMNIALGAAASAVAPAQTAPSAGAAQLSATSITAALPDVVGIRPGISAQQAYDVLKTRGPRARFGIGQLQMPGISDKKIPVSMALELAETEPHETITVWLTTPPSEQVVWAVGRKIEYEQGKPLLRDTVISGLRQKYGSETDGDQRQQFWAFDEQGNRVGSAGLKTANCMNRANWSLYVAPPANPTYDFVTPLLYAPGPRTVCDSLVEVKAMTDGPTGTEYVSQITVIVSDLGLARRSQEAYQAFLNNAATTKDREELDKARQRKAPSF